MEVKSELQPASTRKRKQKAQAKPGPIAKSRRRGKAPDKGSHVETPGSSATADSSDQAPPSTSSSGSSLQLTGVEHLANFMAEGALTRLAEISAPVEPQRGGEGEPSDEEGETDDVVASEVNFGRYQGAIVGIRYYEGVVGKGEQVRLVREPHNQYDRNAIAVWNISDVQVGHIPREVAAVLAPLIDRGDIRVEGFCPTGGKPKYRMGVSIDVYGKEEKRAGIVNDLKKRQIYLYPSSAAPSSYVGEQSEMENLLRGRNTQQSDRKAIQTALDELMGSVIDMAKLPLHPSPPSQLKTSLLSHQLQGLAWCVRQEHPALPSTPKEQPVQFWAYREQDRRRSYLNVATASAQERPVLSRGGILADDMGLGKTLTMIALILSDPTGAPLLTSPGVSAPQYSTGTLIISPLAVVNNWASQIEEHTNEGALSYYVYHGPNRLTDPKALQKFDVVITTYQTVSSDFTSAGSTLNGPLFKTNWRRIILDEGHLIKSRTAKQSIACTNLNAERRWVVSGTPITNKIEDLYALLSFLRFKPFDSYEWWSRSFLRPIKKGYQEGFDRLKALMKSISIRRNKSMKINGKPIIKLPKCTVYLHKLDFTPEERALYAKVEKESKRVVENYLQEGTAMKNYTHILQILMRLRQICDHTSLCPQHFLESLSKKGDAVLPSSLTEEDRNMLMDILRDVAGEGEECPICLDTLKDSVITVCRHVFCEPCILKVIETQASCPLCRTKIQRQNLVSLPPAQEESEAKEQTDDTGALPSSSKINALIQFLKVTPKGIRSIVFSQWTSMLDLIEPQLRENGIRFLRYDGKMQRKAKDECLELFKKEDGEDDSLAYPVLLMSLKCGSLGLNLTQASQVFLMDPWWNTAIETQAIDRVYRLGQTKAVNVFRFVVKETVEERVLEIQKEKKELIDQAFQGIKGANERNMVERRLQDIRSIFSA